MARGIQRVSDLFREVTPREERAGRDALAAIQGHLAELVELMRAQTGGAGRADDELTRARAREADPDLPAHWQEVRAGESLDVVGILGGVAASAVLLSIEATRFTFKKRRDGAESRPVELPAGSSYQWRGRGLAELRVLAGRVLVGLDTAGDSIVRYGGGQQPPVVAAVYGQRLDQAQAVQLDTGGRTVLDVGADSSAATTFHLDASADGEHWFLDYATWEAVTQVRDGFFTGWRYVRLRADAAVAGEVSLALGAS